MAEALAGSSASEELAEPSQRGRLVIRDKVVQTIAEAAALEIRSVIRTSSPFNPLSRSLPSAAVTLTPSSARVAVSIATMFDRPLFEVAAEVRDHVAETVTRLTAMAVDVVNVEITSVGTTQPATTKPVRRQLT